MDWTKIGQNCVREALSVLRGIKTVAVFDNGSNPHTDADLISHNAIVSVLENSGAPCTLISEESEQPISINGGGPVKVIVDPIDGTVHFMRGELGFCAVGMIVIENGQPAYSFVGDVATHDIYHCDQDGAYKNGVKINVSGKIIGKPAIAGWALAGHRMEKFSRIFAKPQTDFLVCNFGQMLQAAKIPAGHYDACFEILPSKLRDFAGAIIAWRAGGELSTLEGKPIVWDENIRQTMLISRDKELHQKLLTAFNA